MEKSEKKIEKETGAALYKWLIKRVKGKIPADRPELEEACTDPLNALLTGYAMPEAYAPLLQILLKHAGFECIPVDGTMIRNKEETDWTWNLCKLDGEWLYADPALDDLNDSGQSSFFAKEWPAMEKTHLLSETCDAFLQKYFRSNYMDTLLREDRETVDRLKLVSRREGRYAINMFIDGAPWSLGQSGPVTIRVFRNYEEDYLPDFSADQETIDDFIRNYLFVSRVPWREDLQFYYDPMIWGGGEPLWITAEDITVLEYDEALTRFVVQFNTPGRYNFNGADGFFCVLDPDNADLTEAANLLNEALENCEGGTDREKAKWLQDWVASKLTYNHNALKNAVVLKNGDNADNLITAELEDEVGANCDPFSPLISGEAVCSGYANLYTLLLNSVGIPAFTVSRNDPTPNSRYKIGHAWTLLRLDGEWVFADPTWDDNGKTSASRYFAGTAAQYLKHHGEVQDSGFMESMINTLVYDQILSRFNDRYAPKLNIPESLLTLQGDASAYGFPAEWPNFYQYITLEMTNTYLSYTLDRRCNHFDERTYTMNGDIRDHSSESDTGDRYWPIKHSRSSNSYIYELTFKDYDASKIPEKGSFIRQTLLWAGTELDLEEYHYSESMEKNEIRGYSGKSYRTWTFDGEHRPKAASWTLEKNGATLAVTAFFDTEGKTQRYSVAYNPPAGGYAIRWEAGPDGTVTGLYAEQETYTYTLQNLTDSVDQAQYITFRKMLTAVYPKIPEEELRADGVQLYLFTLNNSLEVYPNRWNGTVIATRDPLFVWTETGSLELNPDAKDLNGKTVQLQTAEELDLSYCRPLTIAE